MFPYKTPLGFQFWKGQPEQDPQVRRGGTGTVRTGNELRNKYHR